jgi:hypothetical protein
MGKYDPLIAFLQGQPSDTDAVEMSFRRLEQIIGDRLPPTARADPTWWDNTVDRNRAQAHAWLSAVWKVRSVDLDGQVVTFVRGRW